MTRQTARCIGWIATLALALGLAGCGVDVTSDDGRSLGSGSGSGSGSGQECARDSDCPSGLECEIEEEHGETWSYCKPHGGDDD